MQQSQLYDGTLSLHLVFPPGGCRNRAGFPWEENVRDAIAVGTKARSFRCPCPTRNNPRQTCANSPIKLYMQVKSFRMAGGRMANSFPLIGHLLSFQANRLAT